MDLDTMLAEAAPARHASLDGPDSPAAVSLYRQITTQSPGPAVGRRRFRTSALVATAAGGVTAAAALAFIPGSPVTTVSPRGGATAKATLAAWTVTRRPNGLVLVTVRELRDAAGLRRTLRADGVPANVRLVRHDFEPTTSPSVIPRSCRAPRMSDKANADLQAKIMPPPGSSQPGVIRQPEASAVLILRPSAIPHGIGLSLIAWVASTQGSGPALSLEANLVLVTSRCTGS